MLERLDPYTLLTTLLVVPAAMAGITWAVRRTLPFAIPGLGISIWSHGLYVLASVALLAHLNASLPGAIASNAVFHASTALIAPAIAAIGGRPPRLWLWLLAAAAVSAGYGVLLAMNLRDGGRLLSQAFVIVSLACALRFTWQLGRTHAGSAAWVIGLGLGIWLAGSGIRSSSLLVDALGIGAPLLQGHAAMVTYLLMLTVGGLFSAAGLLMAANEQLRRVLDQQARQDPLTGVFNRRALFEKGEALYALAQRARRPLSVLAIDADWFKSINDRHGHGGGDAWLVALSDALKDPLRGSDLLGRTGGEEFLVVLPDTPQAQAVDVAEGLRQRIEALRVSHKGKAFGGTVSIGVCGNENSPAGLDALVDCADQALYGAKSAGRNRVVAFDAMRPPSTT